MDLQKAKQIVINSTDIKELKEIEVQLTEYIAWLSQMDLWYLLNKKEYPFKKERAIAVALFGICKERQPDVKNKKALEAAAFHEAAKKNLSEEMYYYILRLAMKKPERKMKRK